VLDAIDNSGLSRSEVAEALGTTKSYISQVLNGATNMTLKTLGALLWASGQQVAELRTEAIGAVAFARPQSINVYAYTGATEDFAARVMATIDDQPHIALSGRWNASTNVQPGSGLFAS